MGATTEQARTPVEAAVEQVNVALKAYREAHRKAAVNEVLADMNAVKGERDEARKKLAALTLEHGKCAEATVTLKGLAPADITRVQNGLAAVADMLKPRASTNAEANKLLGFVTDALDFTKAVRLALTPDVAKPKAAPAASDPFGFDDAPEVATKPESDTARVEPTTPPHESDRETNARLDRIAEIMADVRKNVLVVERREWLEALNAELEEARITGDTPSVPDWPLPAHEGRRLAEWPEQRRRNKIAQLARAHGFKALADEYSGKTAS